MAFCDLSHTFHKQVTDVSEHVFIKILWGISTSTTNTTGILPTLHFCQHLSPVWSLPGGRKRSFFGQ